MITFSANNETVKLPTSWGELSLPAALVAATKTLERSTIEDFKLSMLCHYSKEITRVVGLANLYHEQGNTQPLIDVSEKIYIETAPLFNFFFTEIKKVRIVAPELTKNLVPAFFAEGLRAGDVSSPLGGEVPKGRRGDDSGLLLGPDHLKRLTVWEFALAEGALEKYMQTGNSEFLTRLVAILYRPAKRNLKKAKKSHKYNGDPRQPFNDQFIDERVKLVKQHVNLPTRLVVSWWFETAVKQLPKMFQQLYEKKIQEIPDHRAQKKQKQNKKKASWSDTIIQVAMHESKEADVVANRNLFQFLRERELIIIENERQQREIDELKNNT
jgi:hypothetical protein